ncbi:MAG: hypothetical protein IT384_19565 [Deltaproteobacteria bacterium]|nr:hypothetical protein [Deltaproteobacteria bacterium]
MPRWVIAAVLAVTLSGCAGSRRLSVPASAPPLPASAAVGDAVWRPDPMPRVEVAAPVVGMLVVIALILGATLR